MYCNHEYTVQYFEKKKDRSLSVLKCLLFSFLRHNSSNVSLGKCPVEVVLNYRPTYATAFFKANSYTFGHQIVKIFRFVVVRWFCYPVDNIPVCKFDSVIFSYCNLRCYFCLPRLHNLVWVVNNERNLASVISISFQFSLTFSPSHQLLTPWSDNCQWFDLIPHCDYLKHDVQNVRFLQFSY